MDMSAPRSTCHQGLLSVLVGDQPFSASPSLPCSGGCPASYVEDAVAGLPTDTTGDRNGEPAFAKMLLIGVRSLPSSVGIATLFEGSMGCGVYRVASLVKFSPTTLFVAVGLNTCT